MTLGERQGVEAKTDPAVSGFFRQIVVPKLSLPTPKSYAAPGSNPRGRWAEPNV
jgi:hypothetical protein